jgi:type II restriction/modification system DNA methylase subunit YeeA
MSDFVQQQGHPCSFNSSDSWVILSPIEQSIKQKIEAVGTPLKDWDIQINYGIKTGFNDAFIIPTEKRDEILNNCATEDERERTAELIRPILRGRDIKRYGYDWAGLWLINTHNGVKGKLPRIDINDYPAVKAHLDQYWDKIERRADQGDTPYNLRNCAYLEDFNKPKIVWAELSRTGNSFALEFENMMLGNTGYILTVSDNDATKLSYLTALLNSRLALYMLNQISTRFDSNGWRWLRQFVEELKIAKYSDIEEFNNIVSACDRSNQIHYSDIINEKVYELYGLTHEEKEFINSLLTGY